MDDYGMVLIMEELMVQLKTKYNATGSCHSKSEEEEWDMKGISQEKLTGLFDSKSVFLNLKSYVRI